LKRETLRVDGERFDMRRDRLGGAAAMRARVEPQGHTIEPHIGERPRNAALVVLGKPEAMARRRTLENQS
jgi:hypothetical protein